MSKLHYPMYFLSQGSGSEHQGGNGGSTKKQSFSPTFVSHHTGTVSKHRDTQVLFPALTLKVK